MRTILRLAMLQRIRFGNASLPFLFLCIVLFIGLSAHLWGQGLDRIVPRSPYAIELPVIGNMTCERCGIGDNIIPLGLVNDDSLADFAAIVGIPDTGGWGATPSELRLYFGVQGDVPNIDNYLRIGPTEIGTDIKYIASGDWDGDGHPDIAARITPLVQDPVSNPKGYSVSSMVVWWGNADGNYLLADTTHLEIDAEGWLGPERGYSMDFTGDGLDDLLLDGVLGFRAGEIVYHEPRRQMFFGRRGQRWGSEIGRRYDWAWWGDLPLGKLVLMDQDVDGLTDLIFHHNTGSSGDFAAIRIIYGKRNVIIDTGNVVEVRLDSAWGKYALFADITGDRIPELLVNTGGQETTKAYVGFKGQRIKEQYGTGNDPGRPGEDVWWGKPWATLPLVGQLHDGWAASGWGPIFDFGDGGLDGVGDLWVRSRPDFIFYNGGIGFDSLYDGWIRGPGGGWQSYAVLGDIDGSGVPTIAIGYRLDDFPANTGGIKFVQPSDSVSGAFGNYRYLPPGTDKPTMSVQSNEWRLRSDLNLHVVPNPASDEIRVHWSSGLGDETTVRIADILGQEVMSVTVPAGIPEFVWDASRTFGGKYLITVMIGDPPQQTETTQFVVR